MELGIDALRERRRSASIRLYGLDPANTDPTGLPGDLAELQEVVDLTRVALGTDGAGINLLVDDAQVTLASTGPVPAPIVRQQSICSTLVLGHEGGELIEIADMSALPELEDNPFVDGRVSALRFYAAAPLTGKHGLVLGTLCAWSDEPRRLDEFQRGTLRQFGRSVVNLLDERRRALVPDRDGILRPGDQRTGPVSGGSAAG